MKNYYQTLRKGCSFMLKRAALLSCSILFLFCVTVQTCIAQEYPDVGGITGYEGMQALKGNWRPFNNNSPWNKAIPASATTHSQSGPIINDMIARNITLRFNNEWNPTLHVVNSNASKYYYRSSTNIYRFTHFNLQNFWNPDVG